MQRGEATRPDPSVSTRASQGIADLEGLASGCRVMVSVGKHGKIEAEMLCDNYEDRCSALACPGTVTSPRLGHGPSGTIQSRMLDYVLGRVVVEALGCGAGAAPILDQIGLGQPVPAWSAFSRSYPVS